MGDRGGVRLKMRLRAVLALLFLVAWVSAARNGARGSGSRRTSSNCRGSSSRSSSSSSGSSVGGRRSTLCRPTTTTTQTDQARPSSSSNSFGVTKRPPIKRPTKKATRKTTASSSTTNSANSDNSSLRGFTKSTTRTIPKKTVTKKFTLSQKTRRTTVSSTDQESVSDSIKSTTKILPKKTAPKRFKPPKKKRRTTVSSATPGDEENSSDSSTNTKTPAKKYFQKLKTRLQTAAIWFVENKDKTLDEILVERWKEKCSGTDSKREKRKRCVAAALAETEEDTPDEKLVKGALKSLLEEDSDEVYDFLSTSSSRTFREIENEGDTQELGTEAAVDCQTQEKSGRTKRDAWRCTQQNQQQQQQQWRIKLDKNIPIIPDVLGSFSAKHVMNDADFETLLKQDPNGLNRDAFLLALKPYRTDRNQKDSTVNTIVKQSDVENVLLKSSDQIAVDGRNTVWQTKVQIPILQVGAQTAQKLNAYVRFHKNAKGEIVHMEKPEKHVPAA